MRRRPAFQSVAGAGLALMVLGCATVPPASPSPSSPVTFSAAPSSVEGRATPSVAATPTLGPAKCATDDTTNYAAIGWLGSRVVVLADHFVGCDVLQQRLISANASDGVWRTEATLDTIALDFQIASNGESVIAPSAAGGIVVSADGKAVQLSRPATAAADWGAYGFRATADGGYLVVGAAELDRVAPDFGSITTTALPKGYVTVAPTSDPDRFVLAPADDASLPYGLLGGPFGAYLWDLKTGSLNVLAASVTAVMPSPRSLAYLAGQGNETLSVGSDGKTTAVTLPGLAWLRSPDGRRYLSEQDPQSRDLQPIALRDSTTGRTIVSFEGSIGTPAWRGSVVAVVSGGGDLPSELIVLDSATVRRLSLP